MWESESDCSSARSRQIFFSSSFFSQQTCLWMWVCLVVTGEVDMFVALRVVCAGVERELLIERIRFVWDRVGLACCFLMGNILEFWAVNCG